MSFVISSIGDTCTVAQGSPAAPDHVPFAVRQRAGDQLSGEATFTETKGRLMLNRSSDPAQLALSFDEPRMNGHVETMLTRVSSTATSIPVP